MEEEIKIKKPSRKKPIIIVSVIAAVLLLIVIVVLATSVGRDKPIPSGKIGDSLVNSDGVTFRVDKAEDVKRLGDAYVYKPTNNNFILITITVTNTTKKTITIYDTCVDLYNEAGTKLKEYSAPLYIDAIYFDEDLNPGTSLTFQVAYETNTKTTDETYVAKIGYSYLTSNSDRVKVTLEK